MEQDKNFVTHKECETYREKLINEDNKNGESIAHMIGDMKAMTEQIKSLVSQNKWYMGIIATVVGGVIIWLITKG